MAGVPSPYYYNPQPEDRELTYRSAMLPLGTYRNADGTESPGFAWPGMITEPINALERLGAGGFSNPQDPAAQQDMTTLLLSLYGGNALNPLARVPKGAISSATDPALTMRAYRGVDDARYLIPDALRQSERSRVGLWASTEPEVANTYAGLMPDGTHPLAAYVNEPDEAGVFFNGSTVAPVDISLSNPFVVDAMGNSWDNVPYNGKQTTADVLGRLARMKGHDGLVLRNVLDDASGQDELLGTTIAALRPGTVTSPLTGETLFSDTGRPSLMGSALSSEQPNVLERYYRNGFQTY